MYRKQINLAIVVLAVVAVSPLESFAQNTDEAFQIGLSTPLFVYEHLSRDLSDLEGEERTEETIVWGIRRDVALEFGYSVTEVIVLGCYLQLEGESQTEKYEDPYANESESDTFELIVGPNISAISLPGRPVRPFLAASAGFNLSTEENKVADQVVEATLYGIELLGRVGVRWFLLDGFSLDGSLAFSWTTMSGEVKAPVVSSFYDSESDRYVPLFESDALEAEINSFSVTVLLGASGWIK